MVSPVTVRMRHRERGRQKQIWRDEEKQRQRQRQRQAAGWLANQDSDKERWDKTRETVRLAPGVRGPEDSEEAGSAAAPMLETCSWPGRV